MSVESLFKDFSEAIGRLFDHRPLLQGEISFCQREFEEKRGNREEVQIKKSLEYCEEVKDVLIPQIVDQLQSSFPKFHASVTEAVDLSNEILDKENKHVKNEWLKERRLQRNEKWTEFLNSMTARVSSIDKECMNEVALVQKHYAELEEKLKITEPKEKQTEISVKSDSTLENSQSSGKIEERTDLESDIARLDESQLSEKVEVCVGLDAATQPDLREMISEESNAELETCIVKELEVKEHE